MVRALPTCSPVSRTPVTGSVHSAVAIGTSPPSAWIESATSATTASTAASQPQDAAVRAGPRRTGALRPGGRRRVVGRRAGGRRADVVRRAVAVRVLLIARDCRGGSWTGPGPAREVSVAVTRGGG